MEFETGTGRFGLWTGNLFSGLVQRVQTLLGFHQFAPEVSLAHTPGIDPRFIPKAPMESSDIDTNLLLELSKLGLKHGKLVSHASHPELMEKWEVMSKRAGLPQAPQLIIVESKSINAMTVSPEEVVVTTGLLKKLDLRETCAVLGHELGHATSDHQRPRMVATSLFGGLGGWVGHNLWQRGLRVSKGASSPMVKLVDEVLLTSLGAAAGNIAANQTSVKPTELQADLRGAAICGDPMGLVSALEKLQANRSHNPLRSAWAHVRSGYPTIETRIANLKRYAEQLAPVSLDAPLETAQPPLAPSAPQHRVSQIGSVARIERAPSLALN